MFGQILVVGEGQGYRFKVFVQCSEILTVNNNRHVAVIIEGLLGLIRGDRLGQTVLQGIMLAFNTVGQGKQYI
ncbi:hypothetical protein D3C81_2006770 [compost metagenome]